jgi:hypothetical protein
MAERVFLIHGWSVQETTTYQALHKKLGSNGFDVHEIFLGRYVSLENEVEIRDIARALHRALKEHLGTDWSSPFHIITHSTGALIAKQWIVRHYVGKVAAAKPLRNLVFLAGPHFGSRLAHHGRSMLAQAAYRGDTGKKVLTALELGSEFSWQVNEAWLDAATWRKKGIRPYNLIGDRVERDFFKSRIFKAGYEAGSDMVVRAAAGNLNFRRYLLSHRTRKLQLVGEIQDVPFAALADYTHSGHKHGIMNSITSRSTPLNHPGLRFILACLNVRSKNDYGQVRSMLEKETRKTRRKRPGYSQLDLRFRDEDGEPIEDYVFKLGAIVKGRRKPSRTVAHIHKNKVVPSHLTAHIRLKELEPKYEYFIEIDTKSDSDLVSYAPDPFELPVAAKRVTEILIQDQSVQIDVVLSRKPSRNLFVFHRGDDASLHVRWNREGEITRDRLPNK